jgi:hypothetical protein
VSQENSEAKRPQSCKLLPDSATERYAVIAAESSDSKEALQKRKEEAKQVLYLDRI